MTEDGENKDLMLVNEPWLCQRTIASLNGTPHFPAIT